MQISFPNINNLRNISLNNRPAFCGIKNGLPCDKFERSTTKIRTVKICGNEIQGKQIKDIMFDDRKGGKTPGFIMQDISNPNQYFACTEKEAECRMLISDDDGFIYVDELYGKNNKGDVKVRVRNL